MTTKALLVKKALRDILAGMAIVTTDGIQVTYGLPIRDIERKWTFVGEIRWESEDWATNRSREEVFNVAVGFSVIMAGSTAEEAEEYVRGMASEFEAALKVDPRLGGLCVTSGFQPKRLNSWPIDQAYEAQFETEVRATCRP